MACVSRADDFGLAFSTIIGDSPTRLDGLLYWMREGFHAFDVSRLVQSPTGDYYILGVTKSGRLPWTGGDPQPNYYCGTVMTPAVCASVFLARVRANSPGVISATIIPYKSLNTSATGLAIDPDGNAFVLEASEYVVPYSRLHKIAPTPLQLHPLIDGDRIPVHKNREALLKRLEGTTYAISGSMALGLVCSVDCGAGFRAGCQRFAPRHGDRQ